MAKPIWVTGSSLGTFLDGQVISTELIARPVSPAIAITYTIISGALPIGVTLSNTGVLQGTIDTPFTNNTYNFTVKATDNLGNSNYRGFSLTAIIELKQPVWNTPAGSIGTYPSSIYFDFQFSATYQQPANFLRYELLSGTLPEGIELSNQGLLFGIPPLVNTITSYTFAIRVTDNLNNITDRTFNIGISGIASPEFITPSGTLLSTQDSIWTELQIEYTNPQPDNPIAIRIREGFLPPGLEINESGLIRGYAEPPTASVSYAGIVTNATETSATSNEIVCLSTTGFTVGRPVVFTSGVFGNIVDGQTYYIKQITGPTTFTISATQNGSVFLLSSSIGFMVVTLPPISTGQPTIKTYNFSLELTSPNGNDLSSYSITVINQNTPISQGGPGKLPNSRIPTVYNTRPPTFNISTTDPYYGYYINPIVPITQPAFIGKYKSGEYFAFKMIGHDFDGNNLTYQFNNVPLGLTTDPVTGWITGSPTLTSQTINDYTFGVAVYKQGNPTITSPVFTFGFSLSKDIVGDIIWSTGSDLGTIFNGTVSTLRVLALSDVQLKYRVTSGALPPNLSLLDNGEITGYVAMQPTDQFLQGGDTTSFSFTIEAYSDLYPVVKSSKSFSVDVLQEFTQPTDTLYIKCTPSLEDRQLINSLLTDETIIPTSLIYRANDVYFGKATDVVYQHAYGIYASTLAQYFASVEKNHYWRNITLGEIKTAVAKNDAGEIIYEVVYSEVIDDLVNPQGVSVAEQIDWPRRINLNLGPWYTSVTDIYTSFINVLGQEYYTSLSSGYARTLYPNSLDNMRTRVGQVLGSEYNSKLLPLWMTSQQENGSTTGFIPAWVICYTKPGFSAIVKDNINRLWPYKLNQINFNLDRFSVNKSITYNYDNFFSPPTWTNLPSASPVPNPLDIKDFYVLFPRKTILPNESQQ
jgi:hypothetical protein